jgi:hypothetical protein
MMDANFALRNSDRISLMNGKKDRTKKTTNQRTLRQPIESGIQPMRWRGLEDTDRGTK